MANTIVAAPRIQVVLTPEDVDQNLNAPSSLFDLWLVLYLPGKEPVRVRVDGGPFNRNDATTKLSEIWLQIGEKYAEQDKK
jgi:hypothetical protein